MFRNVNGEQIYSSSQTLMVSAISDEGRWAFVTAERMLHAENLNWLKVWSELYWTCWMLRPFCPLSQVIYWASPSATWILWFKCRLVVESRTWSTLLQVFIFSSTWTGRHWTMSRSGAGLWATWKRVSSEYNITCFTMCSASSCISTCYIIWWKDIWDNCPINERMVPSVPLEPATPLGAHGNSPVGW